MAHDENSLLAEVGMELVPHLVAAAVGPRSEVAHRVL